MVRLWFANIYYVANIQSLALLRRTSNRLLTALLFFSFRIGVATIQHE